MARDEGSGSGDREKIRRVTMMIHSALRGYIKQAHSHKTLAGPSPPARVENEVVNYIGRMTQHYEKPLPICNVNSVTTTRILENRTRLWSHGELPTMI